MGSTNDRFKGIVDFAEKHGIALIYLFGSRVEVAGEILNGVSHLFDDPLADIDVGIVFKEGLPPENKRVFLYSDIFNDLEEFFSPYLLDLVFLEETHSVFQSEAICGSCIYYCSEDFREDYEEDILRRAADFRPFLDKYYEELLEEV